MAKTDFPEGKVTSHDTGTARYSNINSWHGYQRSSGLILHVFLSGSGRRQARVPCVLRGATFKHELLRPDLSCVGVCPQMIYLCCETGLSDFHLLQLAACLLKFSGQGILLLLPKSKP